jgi:transcriptional regulator with XRE-family HTH domain
VGANLRRIREYRRLNQREFAELLEIPYSTLNKYEIGKSFPTPAVFRNLIAKVRANMQYLFTGTGPMFLSNIQEIPKARKADLDQRFG